MMQGMLPLAELIEIETLPVVAFNDRKSLPKMSGIYFVLDEQGTVQYIGRSENIHIRWITHHRALQYSKCPHYKIALLLVSSKELLPGIERACINYFKPKDNGSVQRYIASKKVALPSMEYGHEEHTKLHVTSTRLSEEGKELLRLLAQRSGISMTAILELLIREQAKREGIRTATER